MYVHTRTYRHTHTPIKIYTHTYTHTYRYVHTQTQCGAILVSLSSSGEVHDDGSRFNAVALFTLEGAVLHVLAISLTYLLSRADGVCSFRST